MSEISCEEVLGEIEHYLHGELDDRRASLLADHLADCPPCFERAEFQRRLKEIVRTKCRSEAPQPLLWRIKVALRSEWRTRGPGEGTPPKSG